MTKNWKLTIGLALIFVLTLAGCQVIDPLQAQGITNLEQLVLNGVAGADGATTTETLEIAFTSPVDTTGSNTHNALAIDLAIGNSTGGTNAVRGLQIDAITDDPQVVETAINVGDEWDYAFDTNLPIVSSAMYWFDDFIGDTLNTFAYTVTSGADATDAAIAQEQYGIITLVAGATDSAFADDMSAIDIGLHWQADQGALVFETRLHNDSDITGQWVVFGLVDTLTEEAYVTIDGADAITTTITDGVVFVFDDTAATKQWFAVGVANNTDATGNGAVGTAPAANTYQVFRIEVDDGGADCRFYIDGALVATLTANCVTNTVALTPVIIIDDMGANSQTIDVDYVLIAADRD